jgi:hypothetical protein
MNKFNLQLAGGALLASTALLSGTVAVHAAATIKADAAQGAVPAAFTTALIAAESLTGTTTAASLGPQSIVVDSSANIFEKAVVIINITGADLTAGTLASICSQNTPATGTLTSCTAGAATVTIFPERIRITDITQSTWSALRVTGLAYNNALSMATAGHSISLSGTIFNSAETSTLESITSKAVATSVSGAIPQVAAGSAITVSNTSTPQFAGVTVSGTAASSATLSTVSLTDTTATQTASNLSTAVTSQSFVSTVEVKLTHGVLGDAAVAYIMLNSAGVATTRTTAQFSSGTATWTVRTTGLASAQNLRVQFNGTTAITGWSAGTTTISPATLAASGSKLPAAVSGTATALTRGGMNTQVNVFQPSTNAFASFLRVTNTGSTAGAVTIAVRQSSTGTSLGSYTSAAINPGSSIQISASDIETGAQITNKTQYDLSVSGPISGYVQHIGFKADTGVVTDLTSFRGTTGL